MIRMQVLIIGLDGASWPVVTDLIGKGKLPNMKKLMEQGASGPLMSLPVTASPIVWTTLASGQWDNHEDNGFRFTQRGTGNAALLAGMDEALDFHFDIGPERIYRRIKELGDSLRLGLNKIPGVEIHTSLHPEMCSGMTRFKIRGLDGKVLQDTLWEKGRLQPRSQGENGVRYSTHIYNSPAEIQKALKIVAELTKLLPANLWLTELSQDKNSLILKGRTKGTFENINTFKDILVKSGYFKTVKVESANVLKEKGVTGDVRVFTIRIELQQSPVDSLSEENGA